MDKKRRDEKLNHGDTVYDQLQTVEQLADDFVQKFRDGYQPSIEQYAMSNPGLASQIRELFPTVLMMETARDQSLSRRKDGRVLAGPEAIEQLGDFKIVREIGRGGMGIVYEAQQQSLDRRVALKVLPRNSFDAAQLQQFETESRLAANLHHTNIVPVYGVGQQNGLNYYVMQLIDGEQLGQYVDSQDLDQIVEGTDHSSRKKLSTQRTCEIGRQVAFALAYAHLHETLHRDIKPANLILDAQQNVWITDFGLATSHANTAGNDENKVSGTLRFLPPEKLAGLADTEQGDIYSLGITLIELLTGRSAFEFSSRDELIDQIKSGQVFGLSQLGPRISPDLFAILKNSVAVAPQQRYVAAHQMAVDLENYLEDRPVSCLKNSWTYKIKRWLRREPQLAAMTAACALLLVAVSLVSTVGYFRVQSLLKSEEKLRLREENSSRVASGALDRIFRRFSPDSQFAEFGPEASLNQPVLSDEVVAMLEDLLVFYQQLAANETDDPNFAFRALLAKCRVGEINERLGHYEIAADAFEEALAVFEGLPQRDDYVLQIARLQNQLGFVNRTLGKEKEALAFHEKAISELTKPGKLIVDPDPLIELELSRSHYYLGSIVRPGFDASDLPPAFFGELDPTNGVRDHTKLPDFSQLNIAIGILDSIESESPVIHASRQHLLALCYRELADDNWQQRTANDNESHRKSIDLLTQLSTEFPQESVYRFDLMQALAEIAVFEPSLELSTLEQAYDSLTKASEIGEELIELRPDIASFRVALVHVSFKMATVADRMARLQINDQRKQELYDESERSYRHALLGQNYLVRRYPGLASYRVWSARFSLSLARCPNLAGNSEARNRLIGRTIANLVNLPDEFQSKTEIKALLREANPLIQ